MRVWGFQWKAISGSGVEGLESKVFWGLGGRGSGLGFWMLRVWVYCVIWCSGV